MEGIVEPRPLPQPTPWSRGFWDAVQDRRLVIQRCRSCGELIMYPKRCCPACLGEDFEWLPASGRGALYTYTVQRAGPPSGFRGMLPYVVAVVRLDEGVQMMSNIVGGEPAELACDSPVVVDFEQVDETGFLLPVFRLGP